MTRSRSSLSARSTDVGTPPFAMTVVYHSRFHLVRPCQRATIPRMRDDVADYLVNLNRRFYDSFADEFSDSRGATERGIERVLDQIEPGHHVLDLGCGQARLALLVPATCTYVGVDSSRGMLRVAADRIATAPSSPATELIHGDLSLSDWVADVKDRFDWVFIRAALQHIPSYSRRLEVVRYADRVRTLNGRIVLANWQILKSERLRRRILPWSEVGLSDEDLDRGDYLVGWARGGSGMRYVHLIDEAEVDRMAAELGLEVTETYYADGHSNDLTLYAILV